MTEKNKFINKYIKYDKKWNPDYLNDLVKNNDLPFNRINDLLDKDPELVMYELVEEFSTLKNHFDNHDYQKIKEKSNELNKLVSFFIDYVNLTK